MSNKMNLPNQQQLLYQLITSEERYQNFMNATTDAIFIHNLNGVILDVNNEACITLGYSRKELINSYAWEIEIAINKETIKQNIIKLSYGPLNLEGLHRRKDGTTFPVDVRLSMFSTMGEQFILAIVRDISEQKRAESTIRKLTRALDQSPVLIIITDKAGTIDYVNERVSEKTGYNYREIIGQNFLTLQSEKTPIKHYKSVLEHLAKGKEWRGTMLIKTKKGEYQQLSVIFSPLRDETNKEIIQYLIIMEEVSR
ncbi:PAS domain-containing protein [Legionella quateirensis]|uniref:Sensory box (GGDEF/EAL domain) regulatory protein n=1 Tax=Legionella quateirensis TaxID=45072 RepID=A0A378L0D8_9GAMM|nr:PAS domain S-box protein [Legionella quateirensis]KTD49216.1 sensory box (GGDEF/EAL domain) regulatory protein [Legionella quateirensis]STY19311.1 sensory box (GGDEF/EAL domain) regulatory protein [Legionella quateirensis]